MQTIKRFRGEYFFLSNFSPCTIEFEGITYPSIEHAYQAAKTLDHEKRKECLDLSEAQSKKWGRSLQLRPDWGKIKIPIMETILRIKFSNPELQRLLLKTHPWDIVEENTWGDTFWGVCNGKGSNHLGKLLIKIRNDFIHDMIFNSQE